MPCEASDELIVEYKNLYNKGFTICMCSDIKTTDTHGINKSLWSHYISLYKKHLVSPASYLICREVFIETLIKLDDWGSWDTYR